MVTQKVGTLELVGYSMAGEESVICVPEFNVGFDFGRGPRELMTIDHVCLSHGHMDHAAGIAYYFSQRFFLGIAPGTVILHKSLVGPVERLMQVWMEIEGHVSPGKLVGIEPGEDVVIRRDLVVRPFLVAHRSTSLGFAVLERRHKLKAEFAGLSGPQLVELKKKGVEIEHNIEIPRVTYCGDTTAGAYLHRDDVKNAEVLLLECTFFDDEHIERARAGRHFHVRELVEVLPSLNCPHIVITHVTRRTNLVEAKAILARHLRRDILERITFLMDRPPRRSGGRPDRGGRHGSEGGPPGPA